MKWKIFVMMKKLDISSLKVAIKTIFKEVIPTALGSLLSQIK